MNTQMKAIVNTEYASPDLLQLKEVEKPTPKDNEVLIKIHAATVTAGDCQMRSFKIPTLYWLPLRLYMGIIKPRINILGQELAGEIDAVGKDVQLFKKGDQVFAPTKMTLGAYAEYICLPEKFAIALKPANITYEEAATIPTGGLNALHFLRKADIQRGDTVLLNGAGGSIGTYAIQIAKLYGAEVTAVDSTGKLGMLRSIGADHVIDYTQEDFTKTGKTYDVVIDIVGKCSFSRTVRSLKQSGRFVLGNPTLSGMIRALLTSITGTLSRRKTGKKVITALASYKAEDLNYLKELIGAGRVKPVIDKCYPLEQLSEAHRYVEKGYKKGNVVITVGGRS